MKKDNVIAKAGNFIGNNKVPLLYIGGAIAVLFIGIPLIKRFKGVLTGDKLASPRAVEYDFDESNVDKNNATITVDQAKTMANQLVGYMSVSSGTDESGIKDVFSRVKNADDMKRLYNAFGSRKYSNVNQGEASGVAFGVLENIGGYNDWDLLQWLEAELGVFDWVTKRKVNEKLDLIGYKIN